MKVRYVARLHLDDKYDRDPSCVCQQDMVEGEFDNSKLGFNNGRRYFAQFGCFQHNYYIYDHYI